MNWINFDICRQSTEVLTVEKRNICSIVEDTAKAIYPTGRSRILINIGNSIFCTKNKNKAFWFNSCIWKEVWLLPLSRYFWKPLHWVRPTLETSAWTEYQAGMILSHVTMSNKKSRLLAQTLVQKNTNIKKVLTKISRQRFSGSEQREDLAGITVN